MMNDVLKSFHSNLKYVSLMQMDESFYFIKSITKAVNEKIFVNKNEAKFKILRGILESMVSWKSIRNQLCKTSLINQGESVMPSFGLIGKRCESELRASRRES